MIEIISIVFQAIYYVVEIIQLIMASEQWEQFMEWFKRQQNRGPAASSE